MDAAIGAVTTPAPQAPQPRQPEPARVPPARGASEFSDRSSRNDAASKLTSRLTAQREVDIDDATGSLVYRLIDLSSGVVTAQTPSEARLKLRAYIDGVIASVAEPGFEATA